MMIELENTGIKVNLVSPGFTSTALNGFEGTQSLEEGSRRGWCASQLFLGPNDHRAALSRAGENVTIPCVMRAGALGAAHLSVTRMSPPTS